MDEKTLLKSAFKSANNLIVTAQRLNKGEYTPTKANAMTNAYRSAGQLYLSILQSSRDIDKPDLTARAEIALSEADCKRLDKIAKLLADPKEG